MGAVGGDIEEVAEIQVGDILRPLPGQAQW